MPAKSSAASAGALQDALAVAAPLLLAAVEGGAAADRDERVLEERAPCRVGVHVAGGDGGDAEVLGEVAQGRVAPHVTALVRPLQLDEEALAAEGAGKPGGGVRVLHREAVAGAAREADEAVGVLLDEALGHGGSKRLTVLAARLPGARVRLGEDPAQVRVAPARLDEQRHVSRLADALRRASPRASPRRR